MYNKKRILFIMSVKKYLIDLADNKTKEEIRDMVLKNSEYDQYIFNFEDEEEKEHIVNYLTKFKLFDEDFLTKKDEGYIIYAPRKLKPRGERGSSLNDYCLFSVDHEFITSGRMENLYYIDKLYPDTITYETFDSWFNNFLDKIFNTAKNMYKPRKLIYENMKHVKRFDNFLTEKKIPKITIGIDELLSVIEKDKTDVFRTFRINKDEVGVRDGINDFYTNNGFNKYLEKKDLKHGKLQSTEDSETLLDEKYLLKFFFVYGKSSMELEEPDFIILQYYNTETNERSDILGYSNQDKTNSFYEKLTDSTIELTSGDDTYVYQTTNGGNNWEMKNVQMEDKEMKGTLDRDELQSLINKKKLDINNE